eukprot:TRINITY_DN3389_c0_g3_i1.p1 TRINITY_DN3389_c0_g3~~TRINITY_DN3389_c0_g3_i1.p1  ORF type:complete len:499 (+),score=179.25 TRINITY_DN3389_c0_g3_i1:219-1499(+)
MELWLVRHGERLDKQWSCTAAEDDLSDPGLSQTGLWQAKRTAERLSTEPVTAVYTSPMLRCVQTAAEIGRAAGVPVRIEPGLQEALLSCMYESPPATHSPADLSEVYPAVCKDHAACTAVPAYPETMPEADERVCAAARAVLAREGGAGGVVVVTHEFAVKAVSAALSGAGVSGRCGECTVTSLSLGPWRVSGRCDGAHLDVLAPPGTPQRGPDTAPDDDRNYRTPQCDARVRIGERRGGASARSTLSSVEAEIAELSERLRRAEARRDALRRQQPEPAAAAAARVSVSPFARSTPSTSFRTASSVLAQPAPAYTPCSSVLAPPAPAYTPAAAALGSAAAQRRSTRRCLFAEDGLLASPPPHSPHQPWSPRGVPTFTSGVCAEDSVSRTLFLSPVPSPRRGQQQDVAVAVPVVLGAVQPSVLLDGC